MTSGTAPLSGVLFVPLAEGRAMVRERGLTAAVRRHASDLKARLDERHPGKAAVAVERLSAHYPRIDRDELAAQHWAEDWLSDTAHLPPLVIEEACAAWRRSEERWMPTPGQLLSKAERIMALKLAELRRCHELLDGPPEPTSGRKGDGARRPPKGEKVAPDAHAQTEAPVAEIIIADLDIPGGAEGSVIRAALNGWQRPASVRPWIGRFRVVDASDGGEPDWKLAVDGDEFAFAAVFTGAAIHLGLMAQGGTLRTWSMAFAERFVGKGRGQWADHDPWGVALKPEVVEGKGPDADAETHRDPAKDQAA